MSEIEEVAQSIFEAHPDFFPITNYHVALSIAVGQMPGESLTMVRAVAEALLEIKPCK